MENTLFDTPEFKDQIKSVMEEIAKTFDRPLSYRDMDIFAEGFAMGFKHGHIQGKADQGVEDDKE